MAEFYQAGISYGFWMYTQLRLASEKQEFTEEFLEDLLTLIEWEGNPYGKNDKKQERVSMYGLRGSKY